MPQLWTSVFTVQEKRYIRAEAAKQFRASRGATGADQEAALQEGETRLHYAQHCEHFNVAWQDHCLALSTIRLRSRQNAAAAHAGS